MTLRLAQATFALLGLHGGASGLAAPVPSLAPKSWDLDFEFFDPARIEVVLPGDDRPTVYWYLIYTVTNNSGREVLFYPQFDLVTDTLRVVHGGDNVSPTVFDAVKKLHAKMHPFLAEPLKVGGKLLQGTDNARTSVALFRDFDPQASKFTIFVGGLSGEIARVPNPAFDSAAGESESNPAFFTLRKTLAIPYDLPGDPYTRRASVPVRGTREWVMR